MSARERYRELFKKYCIEYSYGHKSFKRFLKRVRVLNRHYKRLLAVVLLVLLCSVSVSAYAEGEICEKHGTLERGDIVYIYFSNSEYRLCESCIMEFIVNNSEEIGRLMKDTQEQINRK